LGATETDSAFFLLAADLGFDLDLDLGLPFDGFTGDSEALVCFGCG
jgi:hypothetical protein